MSLALTLALTATRSTLGLVIVFFVVFPALAHVLIGVAVAQVLGEKEANENYRQGLTED
ncbi:hypothetical protein DSM112329_04109 [Paraconexibacter sp. AEG42_29]|uniref:Uncharacterized protein n=1 Tax=Paraconexibacter sp. AEG42_29 TaxID=2997339 RepID=A0AAU7B012_9ACTN